MDKKQIIQIIEQYSRKIYPADQKIQILALPDYKTIFVEQFAGNSEAIVLTEYEVDKKIYWAGYSWRSQTVYVSQG